MRRAGIWALVVTLLLLAGFLGESSWKRIRPVIPEIGPRQLEPSAGQGLLLGILGGGRTVIADITWLRSYVLWERHDRAACEALMRTACALDPRARFFWENAGNIIGYDMAHWEIRRRGGYTKVSPEVQEHLIRSYGRRGLDLVDEGLRHSRAKVALLMCAGQMAEMKLKDKALSAEYYMQAAEDPSAPWFAARFAAVNLWDSGQQRKAYDWYRRQWLGRLSRESDRSPDDLEKLRDMERALDLPFTARIPRQSWER